MEVRDDGCLVLRHRLHHMFATDLLITLGPLAVVVALVQCIELLALAASRLEVAHNRLLNVLARGAKRPLIGRL